MSLDTPQLAQISLDGPMLVAVCDAGLDGNESASGEGSSRGDPSAPSSPVQTVFSPQSSVDTDITDDYAWQFMDDFPGLFEDPKTLTSVSVEDEAETDIERWDGPVEPTNDQSTATKPPTKVPGRTGGHRTGLSISTKSEDTGGEWPRKRKESHSSPTKNVTPNLALEKLPEAPVSNVISWLTINTREQNAKRLRQTAIDYWTSEQVRNIHTDFSAEGKAIIRPRAKSAIGVAKAVVSNSVSGPQSDHTLQDSLPPISVSTIITSVPEDDREIPDKFADDQHKLDSKPGVSEEDTIKFQLDAIASQAPASLDKDQKSALASLSKIMPRDIRQSLSKDNQHCPSQTLKGARCKNTHRANLSNIIHSLDSLMSIKPTNFVQCINDLVTATLCSVHQKVARKELQAWGADLSHVCSIRQAPTPPVSPSNYRIVALADWIRTIGHTDNPSQGAAISVSQPAKMSTPTNVPRVFTTIQNFSRYPIQDSRRSVAESLERLLLRPLTKADISSQGHMYVYWQPGNFGHLKIGRSSDVDRRMTEWVAQCKKPLQVYFPSRGDLDGHPDDMLPVNHIQRVEALVHMELKYCRRIENQCPGCAKAHKEWFEIPHRLAVDVVRKWMAWMRTSPYEKRLSGTEAQWVLKDEAKLRLKGVAQPLKSISIAGPTAKSGRPPSGHLAVSGAGDAKSGRRLTI